MVVITHDVDFCAQHAERIIVMLNGRIQLDGSPAAVFAQPGKLSRAAVDPPQLVRLAKSLRMPGAPMTVDEFVSTYTQWRKRKKPRK